MYCGGPAEQENAGSGRPQPRPGGLFHFQGCGTLTCRRSTRQGGMLASRMPATGYMVITGMLGSPNLKCGAGLGRRSAGTSVLHSFPETDALPRPARSATRQAVTWR
jgi:hypothetical protein